MNYYRKNVNNTADDVKLKMQIGALTLKLSVNSDNISSNKTKIGTTETNISSNLGKIGANETNISSNLGKIGTNETNISSDLGKIGTNETNVSSNTIKIADNETNISLNLEKINSIEENNLKISNNAYNDKFDIEEQSFNFNKNSHSFILFQKVFEYKFNTDGELIINTIINYKYDNLENGINRLTHLCEFFDDKNALFYSITLCNHDFGVPSNSDKNILNIDDNFCFNINNKNNIKLALTLSRINQWGSGNIKLKMIDENYIDIGYKVKTDIFNKFNENDKEIKVLDEKVSVNITLIANNFNSLIPLKSNYIINDMWLFNLGKNINFIYNIQKFLVYENNIICNYKIKSFIELNESCVYLLDN